MDGRRQGDRHRARFPRSTRLDNLFHAALAYSTISKGNDHQASIPAPRRQLPRGSIKVITHLNAPEMKVRPNQSRHQRRTERGQSPKLPNFGILTEISWDGQPVAIVVADTEDRAEYAASLIKIVYVAERGMNSFEEAIPSAKRPKQILGEDPEVSNGDADKVFKSAKHRVDLKFSTPPYNHNAIEPHAAIAIWDSDGKAHGVRHEPIHRRHRQ